MGCPDCDVESEVDKVVSVRIKNAFLYIWVPPVLLLRFYAQVHTDPVDARSLCL
jgi:hypothetical protein